jgi:hypothetical protein
MTKQTAVEWLFLMLNNPNKDQKFANKLLKQAKEIEKEQIMNAWVIGLFSEGKTTSEEYYNQTFKK